MSGRAFPVAVRCLITGVAYLAIANPMALAGPIFLAGTIEGGQFVAQKESNADYAHKFSSTTIDVDGDSAKVTSREIIAGKANRAITVCVIPLPPGVRAQDASVSIIENGAMRKLSSVRFLVPTAAQKLYESIARQTGSVEIVALSGRPSLLIPAFELRRRTEMEISLSLPVTDSQGVASIKCPMPSPGWSSEPVSRVTLSVSLQQEKPLRAVFSPTHEATIERDGLHQAGVRVRADNWSGSDDFQLCWVADQSDLGLRVLSYRDDNEDYGYFLLLGNPTGSDTDGNVLDKDVIFVLDTSGSMRGEKIEQCRAAVEYCLDQLNPGDRFNIITFGTDVSQFRDQAVLRSTDSVSAAELFVDEIVAQGRTNIAGALARSLGGDSESGRPRIVIFLTDGTPTAGEQNPDKIHAKINEWNSSDSRVFVMGVGDDVNAHLLDTLAEMTGGSSEYITPEEEIDAKVAGLYDRLSHPVLTNVTIAFGKLGTNSVYPQKMSALFKGSEMMVFGRYQGGGEHTVSVTGMLNGKQTTYACNATFPKTITADTNEFVAPLWAARNIGHLLQEIRLHGENPELLEEIVRLSKKFGIVTEYTEFLGSFGGGFGMTQEQIVSETLRRVQTANQFRAGRWAVNQARNDIQLQGKVVAGNEANVYFDRQGKKVGADLVQQVGSRCYYLHDGQWIDSEEVGERKTRVVKLFSDEYFQLLRSNSEFSRAQKLGWAMQMNIGSERIVIEKDGKQQSEELRKRSRTAPRNSLPQQNGLRGQQIDQQIQQQFRNFNQIPQQQEGLRQLRNNIGPEQQRQLNEGIQNGRQRGFNRNAKPEEEQQ